jgi:hypothetical protein
MHWVPERTLSAICRCERERPLTLEERLMLVILHGVASRPSVELLKYQAEHGSNALNR